jgi:hypothetical protein
MTDQAHRLLLSALALVLLTLFVALRMLFSRVREMRSRRIAPHKVATSLQMAAALQDVQAADNFRNLFEVPVLFYALVAMAVATRFTPGWLVAGAWGFVLLRYLHSLIHCTYNRVMHRFVVYLAGYALVLVLWVAFVALVNASAT